MKKLSFSLFLCFIHVILFAQDTFSVKGVVGDSVANVKLKNATISILNAKDSTLYKFTRANENGAFSFTSLKQGDFILLLTYLDYADYISQFKLDNNNSTVDFKTINMKLKATLLNEVIIKGQVAAIKIKGDTTEFNAASYTIQPNDKVEDLLKKFPGLQVDKDGKITAQGKTVTKVLVDGEEFFGDDPTLATRNLRADMVDKVQLFDKASEQAAFTGVDDGKKETTLNIKLKEDKKSGYFGKIDAGIGTDNFYQGQAMFNIFKAKQKFSAYGTSGNNGKTGLNWNDADRYGSGTNMEMIGDDVYYMGSGDDVGGFDGRYYGEGIPLSYDAGAHYDMKWNADKESLNANYKIGSLKVNATKNTLNQNNLPSGIIKSNRDENADKYTFRQKADAIYSIKLDTISNLKITVDGTSKNNDSETFFNSLDVRGDNSLLNTSKRSNTNNGSEQNFGISALYTRKFKKLGRNFSFNVSQRITEKESEGYLKSENKFYDTNENLTNTTIVDQYKTNATDLSVFSSNLTYNEPVTKAFSIVFNYGLSINNSKSDRKSFNSSSPGNYNLLDTEFSNDFEVDQYVNQGGLVFSYKKPKTVLNFGTKVNAVTFDQYEAISRQRYNRSFVNWLPQASYQYKFSTQRSIRVGYNGYTNQPSVEQLQPVKVNTDPLNIPLGNPDLKPAYSNNMSLSYNSYKVLSRESIYISGYLSFTNNAIIDNVTTDNQGKTIRQAINLEDKTPMNFDIYTNYRRKAGFYDVQVGINFNAGSSMGYSYINNELNKTTSRRFGPRLNIDRYKDKLEISLNFGPSYTSQVASLQKNVNNSGWGSSGSGYFKVVLPKKVSIMADAQYTYTPKSGSFSNSFEQLIINSSISKSFFKKEELQLMLKANDLLNQNRGFSRYASGNYITQSSYNNISRYFMFSLVWDFSKMGTSAKQ